MYEGNTVFVHTVSGKSDWYSRPDREWNVSSHSVTPPFCSFVSLFQTNLHWTSKWWCFYFISKSNMYIYIYTQLLHSEQFRIGAVWTYWVFFHTCFPFLSNTSVEVGLIFFYLLSIWEKCKPARDKLVFMLLLPAYHSSSSAEPKTKDLCTPTGAIVSFWWLTVRGPRNWNSLFSLWLYFLSFSILNRFYFINAFWWWRVITASYFEFVCSGLLWYNLLMWLLDWIKKRKVNKLV